MDSWLSVFSCAAAGLITSWTIIRFILDRHANQKAAPRRDFHHHGGPSIPRTGGVALAAAFLVVSLAISVSRPLSAIGISTTAVILLSSLAMFAIGLWDDLRPLGAKFKLAAQVGIASLVYLGNVRIELFRNPLDGTQIALGPVGYIATVLWLVSLPNLINLVDGIDGLAAGICFMLMFLMADLGAGVSQEFSILLAAGMMGALVAFLRFNYPPAKIYLGDGGAYFLGFLIALLSIINSNKGSIAASLIAPAFALALPIVDVALAILRRGLRGLPLFRPDRKHIHHRLMTLGISSEQTLLNLYTVSLLCLILAFGIFYLQGRLLSLYTGLLFLVLLIAGHLSGVTRDWHNMRNQLGKLLSLREQTRYALTLDRWLLMEASRLHSLDDIWQEYRFVVRKLGFSKVALSSDGHARTWMAHDFNENPDAVWQMTLEMGEGTVIHFSAGRAAMTDTTFYLIGDLAAETWHKVEKRWRARMKDRTIGSPSLLAEST